MVKNTITEGFLVDGSILTLPGDQVRGEEREREGERERERER